MKKTIVSLISVAILLCSCSKKEHREQITTFEKVTVDMKQIVTGTMNELFDKIELLPLETTDSVLVGNILSYIYVKDKYHIVVDRRFVINVFDTNGKCIGNSGNVIGNGPEEYNILLDVLFNPYSNTIEVLTSDMKIKVYDVKFNYVDEKKMMENNHLMYYDAFPVSKDNYMLLPSTLEKDFNHIIFYDFKKQKLVKKISFPYTAQINSVKTPISQVSSEICFIPKVSTYVGYIVDRKSFTLEPSFKIDFRSDSLDMIKLNRKFPEQNRLSDYLFSESNYPIPMETLFNDQFIVSSIHQRNRDLTFVYDRKKHAKMLIDRKFKNGLLAADYYTLDGSTLLAITPPEYLNLFIDTTLLDEKNKAILASINKDDNPVIMRFKLK